MTKSKACAGGRKFCRHRFSFAWVGTVAVSFALLTGCSGSASDYIKDGSAYLEKGDLPAAVISFKNAVQADPKSLPARLALADALERSGDLQGAEQQCRRALESGGQADELMPRIAVLILDRSENALLVRDFSAQKLKSPQADSDLRALVALAHLGLGQPALANEQLNKATELTAAVRLARAQIAFAAKQRVEAAAEMDAVLKADKVPWWVARAASRVFQANDEPSKALEAIRRAYEAAPMHRGVVGEYAEQLIGANRRAEARPLRDMLRKLAPGYYRTQYLEALFLLEDGKPDLAYTAATKVLAALPAHIPSHVIAATIELERNELASVEARVNKILGNNPDSIEGYRLRAGLELRRNNLLAASVALEKAMSRAPEDRNLLAMASTVSWARGDKPAAVHSLEKAAQQFPPRADLFARLAEMQQLSGQADAAVLSLDSGIAAAKDAKGRETVFNAAIRLGQLDKARKMAQKELGDRPQDPEPFMWLAAVQGTEGNEAGALEQTRRALDLRPDYYPALNALNRTAKSPEQSKEYQSRLQKAVDSGSKDPRVYVDMAALLAATDAKPEKIGELLDKGVAAVNNDIVLRQEAIAHWLRQGRKERALALAKEGEAALPDSAPMTALAASVQERVGEKVQAAMKFGQLAERFPDRVDWNLKHAQNLSQEGKKAEAIKILRRLIQLRSDEPTPYQALVALQLEEHMAKDAQVTAEMLRDKPKMKAAGLLLLGDVYAATDRRGDALKAYSLASEAGAAEIAMQRKVAVLDSTGGEALASAELSKWLAAHPNSIAGLTLAARRSSLRHDYQAAAKYLENIVGLDAKNPVVANDLAWAYVMAHDQRALGAANKALALAPKSPVVLDTFSQAQLNAGQKAEAMATLRQALAIDSKVPIVRLHLAELTAELGSKKDASDLLDGVEAKNLDKEAQKRFAQLKEKL
jgi:putative PEP-CTERM system TPR-repeat lipoprotein